MGRPEILGGIHIVGRVRLRNNHEEIIVDDSDDSAMYCGIRTDHTAS